MRQGVLLTSPPHGRSEEDMRCTSGQRFVSAETGTAVFDGCRRKILMSEGGAGGGGGVLLASAFLKVGGTLSEGNRQHYYTVSCRHGEHHFGAHVW